MRMYLQHVSFGDKAVLISFLGESYNFRPKLWMLFSIFENFDKFGVFGETI